MEGGKYEREWYNDPSRRLPGRNPFPKGTDLLGNHDTHQGEIGAHACSSASWYSMYAT
jgi:hypothetical protein